MGPIFRFVRWLWRHTNGGVARVRVELLKPAERDVVRRDIKPAIELEAFCSSPACTCALPKRAPPRLALVR